MELKLYKQIDAIIKGKTIETITKKWNKILEKTNDPELMNYINNEDNLAPAEAIKDGWYYLNLEWIQENECYVWLNLYREE